MAKLTEAEARVAILPVYDGDGYSYGGGVLLIIGEHAIPLGGSVMDPSPRSLAQEIARRWNAQRAAEEGGEK